MSDELRADGAAENVETAVSATAETAKVTTAEPSVTPGLPAPAAKKMVEAGR
jgi:hypothetical protein